MEKRSGDLSMEKYVIEIPDGIVGVLMSRAKAENSLLNKLRRACHPADIWIPFRRRSTDKYGSSNANNLRELIVKGDNLDIINKARIILYKYIKNEIGVDILQMNPLTEEQIVLEKPLLERYENNSESKLESQPRKHGMKRSAERCRSPPGKRRTTSSRQQEYSSTKSRDKKEKTDNNNHSRILPTHQPCPNRASEPRHPSKDVSPRGAGCYLRLMSAVGTCDDENEDIAKILNLPSKV